MHSDLATEQQLVLTCPFPAAINAHAEWVQEATTAWALRHGLLRTPAEAQRFRRLQYGVLMARAYPTAPRDALALIADWNTWLFLLDDQFDEMELGRDPARLERYCAQALATLRGHATPAADDPASFHALHDIAQRLASQAPPALVERLTTCLQASFGASAWEAANRAAQRIPSEAEYLRHRPYSGAVYCYLTLIELATGQGLPDTVRSHPAIRRLTKMTNNIICWSNDVVSFTREHAAGNAHNLVAVVQHERGLAFDDAIDYVVALHNREVAQFDFACAQAPPCLAADVAVQQYVRGLTWWIRANMDWSTATTRYR